MSYVALIKDKNNIYIMLNDASEVTAFKTLREGLDFFEDAYNANHRRSHEASMSACLNFLFFQPKITKIVDDEIMKYVGEKPNLYQLSHISGFFKGVKLLPEFHNMYETATSPKLIQQ